MRFDIAITAEAEEDFRGMGARQRATVTSVIELHLRHEPEKVSRSRIKRLQNLDHPQYRLRVDVTRVFYDVVDRTVVVLAIVPKTEAAAWLDRSGKTK